AGRAVPPEIEFRVGRLLWLFNELPFQKLPAPFVAGPLDLALQLPQDSLVLLHQPIPDYLPRSKSTPWIAIILKASVILPRWTISSVSGKGTQRTCNRSVPSGRGVPGWRSWAKK